MSNPLRAFINVNRKCHSLIAKLFPQTKHSAYKHYREQVNNNLSDNMTALDIGGGKRCLFAPESRKFKGIKIIALDVSPEELEYNNDADEKIVFDLTSGERVPIDDESVDMITSSSVLEHLKNLENAVTEVSRILKKGGKFISVFPSKFALFAIINQLLPNWLARKILFTINPAAIGFGGFKAYYNRCYYPALKNLLAKHGFKNINFMFDYNQSGYFSFFVPFGLISLIWDCLMYVLHVKPFCAYICFTAEKGS
ncbi:MAG: class I SAM-dependent methyltransferase [Synergistaceae bacterium]|nr:class I SAM-dependent methyltransferase [Synergistaceae bacterium]